MTLDKELRASLDKSASEIVSESVRTDALTDNADGQAWETLREAGFETGDVVEIGRAYVRGYSTSSTSTSWSGPAAFRSFITVPTITPDKVRSVVKLSNDTSDETTSQRWRTVNTNNSFNPLTETEQSVTSTSSVLKDTGWVDLTTSLTFPAEFDSQINVSAGTGTQKGPTLLFGVEL